MRPAVAGNAVPLLGPGTQKTGASLIRKAARRERMVDEETSASRVWEAAESVDPLVNENTSVSMTEERFVETNTEYKVTAGSCIFVALVPSERVVVVDSPKVVAGFKTFTVMGNCAVIE